jgi:nicotinamide riboside kinase
MRIRYLVQGAQSVGKTTLVESLKDTECMGFRIHFVRETARNLISKGISQGFSTTEKDYLTYLQAYASAFRLAEEDVLLFDRSILDPIVFSRITFGRGSAIELLALELWHYIREEVTGIFYIPIEIPLLADGIRIADTKEQRVFDLELQNTLQETGVSVHEIRGSISARKNAVLEIVAERIKNS